MTKLNWSLDELKAIALVSGLFVTYGIPSKYLGRCLLRASNW